MANVIAKITERPIMSLAILALSGVSLTTVSAFVDAVRTFDSLATEQYVTAAAHAAADEVRGELLAHIAAQESVTAGVLDELQKIDANTRVVPELKNLLRLDCMGTTGLDASIDRLLAEYQALAGEPFPLDRWPCERLLASQ